MGPTDRSRFFSCASVVEDESPSMEMVAGPFSAAFWLCLVVRGRPAPNCPPLPLPRPRLDTTTRLCGGFPKLPVCDSCCCCCPATVTFLWTPWLCTCSFIGTPVASGPLSLVPESLIIRTLGGTWP